MKYEYLSQQERNAAKDRRRVSFSDQLKQLEAEHFERELDYRYASKRTPQDTDAMAAARAAQATLDAQYDALKAQAEAGG